VPVNSPLTISEALIPDRVYVIGVPEATFVVDKKNTAVEPSLTDPVALLMDSGADKA
jgi:hypothetical protein